jgi:hypothetical protein
MASILRQKTGTFTTVATTELNSLANGSGAAGAEFDNSASGVLWPRAVAELNVTFGSAPTAGAVIDIYLSTAPDGTNYGAQDANGVQSMKYGEFVVNNTTSAQRLHCMLVNLPPTKLKIYIVNRSGQAFPASGSTIKILPTTDEVASA